VPAPRGSAEAGAAAAVAATGANSRLGTVAATRSSSRDRSSSHVRKETKAGAAAVGRCSSRHCSNWSRQPSRDSIAAVRSSSRNRSSSGRSRSSSHGKSRSHGRSSSCGQERQPQQEQQPRQEQKPRQEQQLWAGAASVGKSGRSSRRRQEEQQSAEVAAIKFKKVSKSGILAGEDSLTRNFISIISVGRPHTHTRIAFIREFKIKLLVKLSTYLCPNCSLLFLIWCLLCT
jgi:hypothetical protein